MRRDEIARYLADVLSNGMTCRTFVETVTDYLERRLSVPDRLRFHVHQGLCLGCRRYLHQMNQTVQVLGDLPRYTAPIAVRQELLKRFRKWKDASPVSSI